MKKLTMLFSLLAAISSVAVGQKTKTFNIFERTLMKERLYALAIYDESNKRIGLQIALQAQDMTYTRLVSTFTVFNGTPYEFYNFLASLEKLQSESPGTSMEILGHHVTVNETWGIKSLWIFDNESRAYHEFRPKGLAKFKDEFVTWCRASKVDFEKEDVRKAEVISDTVNPQPTTVVVQSDKYDRLAKLKQLLDDKTLTQEEYDAEKKKILAEP